MACCGEGRIDDLNKPRSWPIRSAGLEDELKNKRTLQTRFLSQSPFPGFRLSTKIIISCIPPRLIITQKPITRDLHSQEKFADNTYNRFYL